MEKFISGLLRFILFFLISIVFIAEVLLIFFVVDVLEDPELRIKILPDANQSTLISFTLLFILVGFVFLFLLMSLFFNKRVERLVSYIRRNFLTFLEEAISILLFTSIIFTGVVVLGKFLGYGDSKLMKDLFERVLFVWSLFFVTCGLGLFCYGVKSIKCLISKGVRRLNSKRSKKKNIEKELSELRMFLKCSENFVYSLISLKFSDGREFIDLLRSEGFSSKNLFPELSGLSELDFLEHIKHFGPNQIAFLVKFCHKELLDLGVLNSVKSIHEINKKELERISFHYDDL